MLAVSKIVGESKMVKSPAYWTEPASDKASTAAEAKQLKPGKPQLTCKDGDWIAAAKEQGRGFTDNAVAVLVKGSNPAALATRVTPVHNYKVTDSGAGTGNARTELQNRLAGKRK
jgi:hypothetical protein